MPQLADPTSRRWPGASSAWGPHSPADHTIVLLTGDERVAEPDLVRARLLGDLACIAAAGQLREDPGYEQHISQSRLDGTRSRNR